MEPMEAPVIIGHRANTLNDAFRYYYKYDLRTVELDIQLTQDKKIAVYHDDVSDKRMKHLLRSNILVLDEYMKNIPQDLTINIEIKRYQHEKAKQNKVPNDIACRIIQAVKKRGRKNVIYSSFDREITRIIMKNRRPGMLLIDKVEGLADIGGYPWICIEKGLLETVNMMAIPETIVYVYNVKYGDELEKLKALYPFVKGFIVDFESEVYKTEQSTGPSQ